MLVDYFHVKLRQSIAALFPLSTTVEVISVSKRDIYPIPGVDPSLLGVINHYGRLLWVLELSDLLKITEPLPGKIVETLTLVVLKAQSHGEVSSNAERQVACVVSSLQEIISLDRTTFESVVIPALSAAKTFISETTLIQEVPAAVLDVDRIFARLQIADPSIPLVI